MNAGINKNISENKFYQMGNSTLSYYELDSNYMCEYNSMDKIRFIVVFSGAVNYSFNLETITQTNTQLFILPQYSSCSLHVIKRARIMVIEADDTLIKNIYQNVENKHPFNDAINDPKLYVDIKYSSALYDNIQKIHNEYSENNDNPYLVELNVCRLIYNLLSTEYAAYLFSIRAKHPMELAKYYIERNITENIKINDIAEIVDMNGSNFTNTFKRHFGMTPLNYIQTQKMKYAEELLKDNTVTEVAFDVGFENVSSFISQFKKVYNMTPKQYKTINL